MESNLSYGWVLLYLTQNVKYTKLNGYYLFIIYLLEGSENTVCMREEDVFAKYN